MLVTIIGCEAVVFTRMLPKAIGLGDTAIAGGVTVMVPVPLSDATVGEFVALLTNAAEPVAVPLLDGAKRMVTF